MHAEAWGRRDYKLDLLCARGTFAHWHVDEGREEGGSLEQCEDTEALQKQYREVGVLLLGKGRKKEGNTNYPFLAPQLQTSFLELYFNPS